MIVKLQQNLFLILLVIRRVLDQPSAGITVEAPPAVLSQAATYPGLTSRLRVQVGCPESGIDEAVMRLTREGYKVRRTSLGHLERGARMLVVHLS